MFDTKVEAPHASDNATSECTGVRDILGLCSLKEQLLSYWVSKAAWLEHHRQITSRKLSCAKSKLRKVAVALL